MHSSASGRKFLVLNERKLNIKSLRPGLSSYFEVIVLKVRIEGRLNDF